MQAARPLVAGDATGWRMRSAKATFAVGGAQLLLETVETRGRGAPVRVGERRVDPLEVGRAAVANPRLVFDPDGGPALATRVGVPQ